MKIAIISKYHPESSYCLAKYIAKQNIEVDYYYFVSLERQKAPGFNYLRASKGIGLHKLKKEEIPEIMDDCKNQPINFFLIQVFLFTNKTKWIDIPVLWLISKAIKKQHYDAINIVGQTYLVNEIHTLLRGENIIHTIHEIGDTHTDTRKNSLIELIVQDRSKVILPSKSSLQRFDKIVNTDCLKTCFIPFGKFESLRMCYRPETVEFDIPFDKPTFLFYGFFKKYKGLDILKSAVALLNKRLSDFYLILAGAGDDAALPYFKALPNTWVINRFLSDEEIVYLNEKSIAVLLPYKSASQSGIIQTSFAFGKPVICTNVGAMSEIIVNGYNGLMVPEGDYVAFSQAMIDLIDNPCLLQIIKDGVSKFGVDDEYSWNKIALKTIEFFKS